MREGAVLWSEGRAFQTEETPVPRPWGRTVAGGIARRPVWLAQSEWRERERTGSGRGQVVQGLVGQEGDLGFYSE